VTICRPGPVKTKGKAGQFTSEAWEGAQARGQQKEHEVCLPSMCSPEAACPPVLANRTVTSAWGGMEHRKVELGQGRSWPREILLWAKP
jgi:hypothetical protein